jgi:two-component sensor histidine kinase
MRSGKEARMSSQSELLSDRSAVTERLLLREFTHRTNDELASVIRLISAAASRCESDPVRGALAEVQDRLQGYAGIQRSLQMPEYSTTIDLAAYLLQLCRAISGSRLAGDGIELLLSVCPLRIGTYYIYRLLRAGPGAQAAVPADAMPNRPMSLADPKPLSHRHLVQAGE